MKAVVAIDSFKGSLSTFEAGEAAAKALALSGFAPQDIRVLPMSDGGEGFCKVVDTYLSARTITQQVRGPFGGGITAEYLLAGETAYIESASACGYTLISGKRHDPRELTTAGVGEMIADAISRGCTRIFLGLGGTATMDAGLGLRTALRDSFRCGIPDSIEFIACVDTFAPLTGPNGAAFMYGPQKGLRKDQLAEADAWLARQAAIFGLSPTTPGFGAAGGLLCGLASVTANLSIVSGAELLMEISGLRKAVAEALDSPDSTENNILIITGEGRVDRQSLTGKITGRAASLASSPGTGQRAKVICLAGSVGEGFSPENSGFSEVLTITPEGTPLDKALADTAANIRRTLLKHFSV